MERTLPAEYPSYLKASLKFLKLALLHCPERYSLNGHHMSDELAEAIAIIEHELRELNGNN